MKAFIIIIFLTNILNAEWKEAFFKQSYNSISIDCIDSNNCFALINAISAKDNEETIIFKSYNQGKTWNEIYRYHPLVDEPKFLFDPRGASSPNGKDYFISYFERGHLKVSNDSAKTFRIVDLETPREVLWIEMYDENIGVALTPINDYITLDGWKTWEKSDRFFIIEDENNRLTEARAPKFINENTFCLLNSRRVKGIRESCFTKYHLMEDKISHFRIDSTINDNFVFIVDFTFLDEKTIISVGGYSSGIGNTRYNLIYKSTDGGETWIKKHQQLENINSVTPYAFGLQKVDFYDNKNGIAVGQFGSVALTNDGGETWVYDEIPESMDDSPTMQIEWAGRTPIIGTFKGGLYYYEGDYFNFEQEEQFKITGQVTTESGDPVEGSEIVYRIPSDPSKTYSVVTDINGNYVIDDMPNNSSLKISPKSTLLKIRYKPMIVDYFLTKDTIINFIQIKAEEFYDISGKVIEDGEDLNSIPVYLHTDFGLVETLTDEFGNYIFEDVPAGNVVILNGSFDDEFFPYYKPNNYNFDLNSDTTGLDFEIVGRDKDFSRRVSGRVTLNGEGIQGISIFILANENSQNEYLLTDSNGYYLSNFLSSLSIFISLNDIDKLKYKVKPEFYELIHFEYPDGYNNINFELSPISSVEINRTSPIIYPNPASETITIINKGKSNIEIYNILGQKLLEKGIIDTSELNISSLKSGTYIIRIISNNKESFEKVIIQR